MKLLLILLLVLNCLFGYSNTDSFSENSMIEITSVPKISYESLPNKKLKTHSKIHPLKTIIDSPVFIENKIEKKNVIDSSLSQGEWYTTPKSLNKNITGFILSLFSAVTLVFPPLSLLIGIFGLHFSLKNIENSSKTKLAKTGKTLSILAISISAAVIMGYLFIYLSKLQ